jgi:TRAP-type C4-dicarboxylate transport system substrate-binding protein
MVEIDYTRRSFLSALAGAAALGRASELRAANADPIALKVAFFTSDQALVYAACVKPLIDGVNADAQGRVRIEPYFSGALGKDPAQQAALARDGVADIAFVIPGYTPDVFPDTAVVELPGLFRDGREASLVYTRLVAAHALAGYRDYAVLGAYASDPECIHVRSPIKSLDDLSGKIIRVNNEIEADALGLLGMHPVILPINKAAEEISRGNIDGSTLPSALLFEFGVARVTAYHFMLPTSVAPIALLMNRKRFDSLPATLQATIRKNSGEWAVAQMEGVVRPTVEGVMARLSADPRRKVIAPTASELQRAQSSFQTVRSKWAARNRHNQDLLDATQREIAALRPD